MAASQETAISTCHYVTSKQGNFRRGSAQASCSCSTDCKSSSASSADSAERREPQLPSCRLGLAGVLELAGGLLLVLGLFVRPVALILAVEMIVAFVQAHLPQGGLPIENGGELALLYALIFVFLAARGAGPVSVDARQGRVEPREMPQERARAA